MPIASIIIPSYQRAEDLCKALRCIEVSLDFAPGSPLDYEVIVTDDSPSDLVQLPLKKEFPWVTYTSGPKRGPAANRNHGARYSCSDWLLFTDDDCLPQKYWVASFIEQFDQASVLEGKTIADRPKQRLDEESPINENGGHLWSCNMAIKRDVFDQIGGFDESFPYAAIEDVAFHSKLQEASIDIHFCEKAVVIHPWRRSKGISHKKKELLSFYHFLDLHPYKRPKKFWKYFLFRAARGFFKITIPGAVKYRMKGFIHSLAVDGFYAWHGLKAFLRNH